MLVMRVQLGSELQLLDCVSEDCVMSFALLRWHLGVGVKGNDGVRGVRERHREVEAR